MWQPCFKELSTKMAKKKKRNHESVSPILSSHFYESMNSRFTSTNIGEKGEKDVLHFAGDNPIK